MLLTYKDLVALGIDLTRVSLRTLMAKGKFPAAIRLGEHKIAWRKADIQAWIDEQPYASLSPSPQTVTRWNVTPPKTKTKAKTKSRKKAKR